MDEPALIIRLQRGLQYANQVGGAQCLQRNVVGALVPLSLTTAVGGREFVRALDQRWPYRERIEDRDDIAQLQRILELAPVLRGVVVNEGKRESTVRGWIEVLVDDRFELLDGLTQSCEGVLTWQAGSREFGS